MIRVASLKDMVHANYTKKDIAGMTATEQLTAISKKTHECAVCSTVHTCVRFCRR